VTLTGGPSGGILESGSALLILLTAFNTGTNPRTSTISAAGNIVQLIQSRTGTTSPFDDVPLSHPDFNHPVLMRENAITSGCATTSYCPDTTTTRSQMAVFIIRSILGGDSFPFPSTPCFADVAPSHPYFKFIQKMKKGGIATGCTSPQYCPDNPKTRGQMGVCLIRGFFSLR
jgi:hypothetical protein